MAKSSGINLMDYINEKELKKIVKPELKKFVNEVIDDMDYQSFKAIETFYYDYHPYKYFRKYAMYKIWEKSKVTESSEGYLIEFKWSSIGLQGAHPNKHSEIDIDDEDYSFITPSEGVFNGPFLQGYHGIPTGSIPQMTPSPWEIIRDYAKKKYNAYE